MSEASNFELRGLTIWEPGKTALSVATVNQHHPKARTYAHKLVAAGAMYEALSLFVKRIQRHGDWDDGCFYYAGTSASELQEPIRLACAALSLAEGK